MVKRIDFGNLGGGVFGLKISKPGFDVDRATDDQLVLDGSWVVSNVYAIGQYLVPVQKSGTTDVFDASGLSYTPYAEFFVNFVSQDENWLGMPALFKKFLYWDNGVLKMQHETAWGKQTVSLIYIIYARPVL